MDLSILIPCADDLRIAACIDSIDENVQIVIALNGASNQVKSLLARYPVTVCEISQRNIGAALNRGIAAASFERILKSDSDCTFDRGAIRILYEALDDAEIAKGRMVFTFTDPLSKIISRAREYTTADQLKTYPPLAFHKSLVEKVGYYFDEDIHWTEDADLNRRVRAAGIQIRYVPEATVYHAPLNILTDLGSAFSYGQGRRIAERKKLTGISSPYQLTLRVLTELFADARRKKGVQTAWYLVIWQIAFSLGYYSR